MKYGSSSLTATAKGKGSGKLGGQQFKWNQSFGELVTIVFTSLGIRYLSESQLEDIASQLPAKLKELLPVEVRWWRLVHQQSYLQRFALKGANGLGDKKGGAPGEKDR